MDIHSASDAQKPSPKVTKSTLGPYATLKATAEKTVEDEPLLGEIYLPGKPIVSHNHHALERFQAWEKENRSYVSRLSTRKRWDLYITNRDLDGIRNPVDASLIMASLQTIKPSRLAKVV
ncbi:hypothetical protein FRB96_000601 [Tulasnella sp. 330]|nr:hypothetical protein FRB96_000601 [Tulasnella sp. 330]KAG8870587.1 hypothetical protein FRB97_009618 [Tulasnella sp. 331]KAG8873899.1 hypothetical protein FRB98_008723 [Tulasnella sp. 332]